MVRPYGHCEFLRSQNSSPLSQLEFKMLDQLNLTTIIAFPWVVPVVCGCTVAIVAIVAGTIKDVLTKNAGINLTRAMVEQGYSIEQIDHVLSERACMGHPRR
jgi:hypothetical protein